MSPAVQAARSSAARVAALERWARTPNRTAATEPARKAAEGRWLREVREQYPDVDDATAQLMASALRRAYFVRIGRLSAAARQRRKTRNTRKSQK